MGFSSGVIDKLITEGEARGAARGDFADALRTSVTSTFNCVSGVNVRGVRKPQCKERSGTFEIEVIVPDQTQRDAKSSQIREHVTRFVQDKYPQITPSIHIRS